MFFHNQEDVDNFMASYPSTKNEPNKVVAFCYVYNYFYFNLQADYI